MIDTQEQISRAFNVALENMMGAEPDRSMVPVMIGFHPSGETAVFPMPWCNNSEKELMVTAVSTVMKHMGCIGYLVMVETWMASVNADEEMKTPPSQRPNRIEALIIYVEYKGQAPVMCTWRMERDPPKTGNVMALVKMPDESIGMFDGIFTGLLDNPEERVVN